MNAPADPHYVARIRASFGRQKAMALIGASLTVVEPGLVEVALPYRDDLTQQKGFIHGGIIGMIADTACGYSAFSLMPADCSLVTVEYKINILTPARGSLVEIQHPSVGKARVVGVPARLSATPGSVRTPSPRLGEHTDEVLRDLLGLGAQEIGALRAAKAIG